MKKLDLFCCLCYNNISTKKDLMRKLIIFFSFTCLLTACATVKETPTEEPPSIIEVPYNENQVKCLIDNAFFESKTEKHQDIKFQIYTTIKRAYNRNINFCQAVYEPYAFSWTHQIPKQSRQGYINRNKQVYMNIDVIVRDILIDEFEMFFIKEIWNADHYITVQLAKSDKVPYWFLNNCEDKERHGAHIFCRGTPKIIRSQ